MDPNTKRYNDFVNAYKRPVKLVQLEKAQKLWNDVKNDLNKFEETSADLQKKNHRRESSCHTGQTRNQSLQKNQVNSQKLWLKHRHHPVSVEVSQLLMHLFKVKSISFIYFFFP